MSVANFPTLIVEAVFTDITAYVQSVTCTAGSSSRVTTPLVQFEAGTATIQLNNKSRAFDPLNTSSPYYLGGRTVVVPVPGTFPNADPALGTGQAFDAQVQTAAAASTQAAAGFATGSGSAFDATVTGTTTVNNIPSGMLFGASAGGGGQAPVNATTTLLHPKMWRTFETTPTAYSNTAYARFVPNNVQQFISFKYDVSVLSDTSNGAFNSTVANAINTLSGLSDIPGHWCAQHHEPQGDGLVVAEWQQCQINFRHYVVDVVNTTRTHPIFFCNPMNGFLSNAQADAWFSPAVLAVHDAVGWDCYGYNTGQDQALSGYNYALSKGKRFIIPEIGFQTGGSPGQTTDTQELSVMQSVTNHIAAWPTANRPVAVLWFNGNSSSVAGDPNSATFWKNVCDTSSVAP